MSIWSHNPEWFDEWALEYLEDIGINTEDIDNPWDYIDKNYRDKYLQLARTAEEVFIDRLIPG